MAVKNNRRKRHHRQCPHEAYQAWVMQQDFFKELVFIRGDALFIRTGEEYNYLPMRVGFLAFCHAMGLK